MYISGKVDHYRKKVNIKKIIKDIILVYIIAVIFVLLFNSLFIQAYKINSNSMMPQINDNTWILVNKFVYGPKYPFTEIRIFDSSKNIRRGDIIVFMSNEYMDKTNPFYRAVSILVYTLTFTLVELPKLIENKAENVYIKRIIGLPGDVIEFKLENDIVVLYINGAKEFDFINKDYRLIDDDDIFPLIEKYVVKKDEYYVLGDNRKNSTDSRIFGSIKSKQIIGKAILQYYPRIRKLK